MRRSELILGGLLGIGVVAVSFGFIFYWFFNQSSDKSLDLAHMEDLTTLQAYNLAQPVAQGWSSDAALLTATAGWQPQSDFMDGRASWNFVFYSLSQKSTAVISVMDAKAQLVRKQPLSRQVQPGDISGWQIDSPMAIEQLLLVGADDFMKMHANVNLVLTLDVQGKPTWRSTFLDVDSKQSYSLNITADTGEFTQ